MALASFLLAASPPFPAGAVVAFTPRRSADADVPAGSVEMYDPVGRAQLMAERIPRAWRGTFRSFGSPAVRQAALVLQRVVPLGQMVDLRGELTLDGVVTPVQGTINAKSNQLDLLVLGNSLAGILEPGGQFQGQQGLSLSGWQPDRLTGLGGRLQLRPGTAPVSAAPGGVVRGLW